MLDLDKMNERCANAERMSEQYILQINNLKQRESQRMQNSDSRAKEINDESLVASKISANNFEIELIAKEKEIAHLVEGLFYSFFNHFNDPLILYFKLN